MKGLLIKKPWIDMILAGEKTWELRGRATQVRGRIALIRSGSGNVFGTCDVVDVVGPLTSAEFAAAERKHRVASSAGLPSRYRTTYAWVLANPRPLKRPRPYEHPQGAVIWVNLPFDLR